MSMRLKKFQTNVDEFNTLSSFRKLGYPFGFLAIPLSVVESSETYRVSDKCFGNRKGILRTNGYSEIPLWFSRIRIGFPTVKKRYSRKPPGR